MKYPEVVIRRGIYGPKQNQLFMEFLTKKMEENYDIMEKTLSDGTVFHEISVKDDAPNNFLQLKEDMEYVI